MKARDFIKTGEKVMVVFTHGIHFEIHDDNTGSTGWWKADINNIIDRVLIYYRNDKLNTNELYIANHAGVKESDADGRRNIKLEHIQCVGVTSHNWKEFAETDANPVRYLP